jgi:hypothetical protein
LVLHCRARQVFRHLRGRLEMPELRTLRIGNRPRLGRELRPERVVRVSLNASRARGHVDCGRDPEPEQRGRDQRGRSETYP